MKFVLPVFIVMGVLASLNENATAKDSQQDPVSISVENIEPMAWLPGVCQKKFSVEPKYVIQVRPLSAPQETMTYRTFSDLCSFPTAQFIGSLYVTESGRVIGISGTGDTYIAFSRYAMLRPFGK